MSRFTDADGRDWVVLVTTVELTRVRDELGVDLLDVGNEQLFHRLTDDECLIVDVLHACCREQCQERDIDATSFARGLRGDALDAATNAFLEAYGAFFRRHRRAVLTTALAKTQEYLDRSTEHAIQTINSDKMDRLMTAKMRKIDQELDEQLREAEEAADSGSSSPSGPAWPESHPEPG